jgi:hypothetical protein
MKDDELDKFISRSLQKAELEIPEGVQADLRRLAATPAQQSLRLAWKRRLFWGPLLAAAVLAVAVVLPQLFPPKPDMPGISQIRTEISIPEKNIRIIWLQRDDFHLTENN